MEQNTIDILSHPNFDNRARLFYEKYALLNIRSTDDPNYSKRSLKGYSSRMCRFCGRGYPDTKFSNYSHLVPQLIGNTNLYSDFECDACNELFSGFENDLSAFLGISRSITGLGGVKKVPGLSARRLRAKSRSFIGDNILIIAPEDVKREGDKTIITYVKNPFIPSNVYKAVLKCALSLLSDREVKEDYQAALGYLMGKVPITNGAIVSGYQLSFNLNLPLHVYIFQKRIKEDKIPDHVICFHFHNHIIAFPVPCCQSGNFFFPPDSEMILPPPYFTNQGNLEIAMPISFIRDLSSGVKVTDEEEDIGFELHPESLKNSWAYDPATDKSEKKEFNPSGFKYLIITKEGMTVGPKAFSAFIREQMEENN